MTRVLMTLALVATLVSVAAPNLSIAPTSARPTTEQFQERR